MALIAMVTYDNEETGKAPYTQMAMESIIRSVNFEHHRLFICDNGSTDPRTIENLKTWETELERCIVLRNGSNIGTANAINRAWSFAEPDEVVVKMDNDVIIHDVDWLDDMEECFRRDDKLAILGLKRRDCMEATWHEHDWFRSEIKQLPHIPGQKWFSVESVHHVMGTCQAYSVPCREKLGFLFQWGPYGFDDAVACFRSEQAGFYNAFLCGVDIEHIDPGDTPYQTWKETVAGDLLSTWEEYKHRLQIGKESVHFDGGDSLKEFLHT